MSEIVGETLDQRLLCRLLNDLSEEAWCSGWFSGIERDVYRMIWGGRDPNAGYGRGLGDYWADDLADIKAVAERCQSWIVWDDDARGRTVIDLLDAADRFGVAA